MQNKGLVTTSKWACYQYDFDVDGGGIGAHVVKGDVIPKGSIIVGGRIVVNTAVTSAGSATMSMEVLTAADIKTLTAKATYALAARLATIPDGAAANDILVTADIDSATFTVAVAALTAGKVTLLLKYLMEP